MWSLVYGRLWLMRTLTDSEILLGLVITANLTPVILFSLLGGILSDKYNRLKILRFTRFLFAIATFVTGILIHTNVAEPWHVLVLASITGTLLALDIPARSAMVARIVPKSHLPGAIIMYSIIFGGSAVIGPLIFAPLVSVFGLHYLFYMIGSAYVFTVLTLFMMRLSNHSTNAQANVGNIKSLVEGFIYLKNQKTIKYIIMLGILVGLFGTSFETLLPVFTDEIYFGGSETYGQILLFLGSGGLLGTLILTFIGKRLSNSQALIGATILVGISLIVFSFISNLSVALMIVPIIGLVTVAKGTIGTTVIQTLVDDQFRGRIMSLQQWSWGASAFGGIFAGSMAQFFGAPITLFLGGLITIVVSIYTGLLLFRVRTQKRE
jgi:MFS family permease